MKVVVGMLAVLSTVVGQTCFEGPGGATVSDTKAGGHNIQVLGWRWIFYVSFVLQFWIRWPRQSLGSLPPPFPEPLSSMGNLKNWNFQTIWVIFALCVVNKLCLLKVFFLQESTWFSFSTHWTLPLSVPPRSSPSTTGWKSSGHLVPRLVLVLVYHTGCCMPNSRW